MSSNKSPVPALLSATAPEFVAWSSNYSTAKDSITESDSRSALDSGSSAVTTSLSPKIVDFVPQIARAGNLSFVEFVPAAFQNKTATASTSTVDSSGLLSIMATPYIPSQEHVNGVGTSNSAPPVNSGLLSVTATPYSHPNQEHVNVVSATSNAPSLDLGLLSVTATPYAPPNQEQVNVAISTPSSALLPPFPSYSSLAIPPPQPPQQQPPLCRFFARGGCQKGMDCPFRHDKSASSFASPFVTGSRSINGTVESVLNKSDVDEENGTVVLYYAIQDGIRCAFQNGLKVMRLQLGSLDDNTHNNSSSEDGKTLTLSGLTLKNLKEDLVARMELFGPVTSLTRKLPTYALVTFGEARHADEAVKALCGSSVQSWMKSASKEGGMGPAAAPPAAGRGTKHKTKTKSDIPRTTPVSATRMVSVSLLQNHNQAVTTRGVTIKVLWYAPSRCAWVHFSTMQMATAAAKACHGATFCGQQQHQRRVLTTSVQAPTMGQQRSFSVWIGGLPDQVREEELKRFVHKQSKQWVTSVALGDIPFSDNQGAAIVKTLLEQHGGRLVHFEEFPNQGEHLKRRALAKFSNAEQASKACRYFGATKHVSKLGGSKLLLTRTFLAKSTVSNLVFCAIERELIAKLSTLQDTRYKFFRNEKTTTISINAERPDSIASAKSVLRLIVTGKAVAHTPLLMSLWRSPRIAYSVELEIQRLNTQNEACGLLNRRKQEIRLFGSLEAICALEQIILKSIDKILGASKMSVPISDGDYLFLLQGGRCLMHKLISMSFVRSVSLDIKNRAMIVEGGSVDVKKIMANVHKLQRFSSAGGNSDANDEFGTTSTDQNLCPVCFCPPEDDASGAPIQLSCSHSYCKDCFHEWITGTRTCQYPLECLSDGCLSSPPLEVLERCLTGQEFQRSMREAVDDHVNKNLDSFQFCYMPGCSGICRLDRSSSSSSSSSRLSCCSTCDTTFCTECKVEEHEELSCEQYRAASLPPNRVRIKIVDEILTLRCPRCSLAFLDFEGCFALRCSACPCGFCGWCLQDCGTDAHSHVATCPAKLGTDKYFGSEELFEKAQRKRRRDALVSFLKTLGRNDRAEVHRSIQTDLNDLGIFMEDLEVLSM